MREDAIKMRAGIFDQRQHHLASIGFSKGGGDVGAHAATARQRHLHALAADCGAFDEFGVAQHRRTRQHDGGDFRLGGQVFL